MAKQLMIYEKVVPVSAERHRELSFETDVSYEFARDVRAVPLVAEEILQAAREYTVVFAATSEDGASVAPFAILGVSPNENVYVSETGEWTAKYIPAFIRRYPFVFSTLGGGGSKLALCVDESWQGFNREGRGQRLFDDDGDRTPFLQRLINFNEEYQRSSQRTAHFCQTLNRLDVLDQKEATLTIGKTEEALRLKGLMVVSRAKLHDLPDATIGALAKSGALELVYAHLDSLRNMQEIGERVMDRRAAGADVN